MFRTFLKYGIIYYMSNKVFHNRRLEPLILQDLEEKMVFVAGPRQSGKTMLSKHILAKKPGAYYNWDNDSDRKKILNNQADESASFWIFDELHKFRRWRNWLKGLFDFHNDRHSILVTGSAKLDVYRRGGDSLQGRYYFYRLHPFTFSEYLNLPIRDSYFDAPDMPALAPEHAQEALSQLLTRSGFPEPLLSKSERNAARWRLAYSARLVREDIQSVEGIRDLDKLELLFDRLEACVGSVLSINSLREDLEVSFPTVKNWIRVLEAFYACYRIAPFGGARIKAVKKEQKLYLWDYARVENESARFENLIASHLLRFVHWLEDVEGEKIELRYFRNIRGQEVDFILLRKGKPWMAVEVKLDDRPLDPSLRYFLERVSVPYAFQVSLNGKLNYRIPNINGSIVRVIPATLFLANLP